MARVYISIGSNIDRENNFRKSVRMLRKTFGGLTLSSIYETKAVGFDGDPFFNAVIAFNTEAGPDKVVSSLQLIETACGRKRSDMRFSARTMDLDLLLYDDLVVQNDRYVLPRKEIEEYAFVLQPLAEIAGDLEHPLTKKTYSQMWQDYQSAHDIDQQVVQGLKLD